MRKPAITRSQLDTVLTHLRDPASAQNHARGHMFMPTGFCALGHVAIALKPDMLDVCENSGDPFGVRIALEELTYHQMQELFGTEPGTANNYVHSHVIELNDNEGASLSEIADYIERTVTPQPDPAPAVPIRPARLGDIGEGQREITFEPLEEPLSVPVPETVPAEPEKVPA